MYGRAGSSNVSPRTIISFVISTVAVIYFFGPTMLSWFEPDGSPTLQQGQRIMYQMMGQETLRRAGFFEAHPAAEPSDFVEFVNSSRGDKLWPPSVSEFRARQPAGVERSPRRVLRPDALSFSAWDPNPSAGHQIVYVPLDDSNQMEIRGYEKPGEEPAFVYTWEFPTDAGAIRLD